MRELKADPSSILSITFTRLAALEMRSRAWQSLGDKAGAINFSTFHSLFFKILRHTYKFSSDNIIKPQTKINILKDILYGMDIEPLRGNNDITELLNEISVYKCAADNEGFSSKVIEDEDFLRMYERYTRKCSSLKLIDFDDMPLKCRELFRERPEVLRRWQDIFQFILVDEFQDIDPVQFELIKLLAARHENLFAVGDDDQSIYSFRGSAPDIMLDFESYYPAAKKYFLSENYRCAPQIVQAAGRVIAENKRRIGKEIVSCNSVHGEVTLREFKNSAEELKGIVEEIASGEAPLSDFALLFRTNGMCERAAEALNAAGIPFRCREKLKNIYDTHAARDLLDYLRLARGVKLRSTMYRVMNHPYRFISRESIRGEEFDFNIMKEYHRYEPETVKRIDRLRADIKRLAGMKPYGAIHYILNSMGYLKYAGSFKDRAAAEEAVKAAREILERSRGYRSHEEFLNAVESYTKELAVAEARSHRAGIRSDKEAVSLMTYHASKGLEFNTVYLPSVNEGVIPGSRIVTPEEFEEERRLFYVGMTRAEKSLHISWCLEEFSEKLTPSRFLKPLM